MGMNELLKKYKIISNDPYIPLQPDESAPESLLGGLRPRRHSAEESVVQIPLRMREEVRAKGKHHPSR